MAYKKSYHIFEGANRDVSQQKKICPQNVVVPKKKVFTLNQFPILWYGLFFKYSKLGQKKSISTNFDTNLALCIETNLFYIAWED